MEIIMIYNWWEEQKRYSTTLYYMIATFLFSLCVCICLGLLAIPVVLAGIFSCWLWLLLWLIMLPLCVGVVSITIRILE
jgi:hypothetical protein